MQQREAFVTSGSDALGLESDDLLLSLERRAGGKRRRKSVKWLAKLGPKGTPKARGQVCRVLEQEAVQRHILDVEAIDECLVQNGAWQRV